LPSGKELSSYAWQRCQTLASSRCMHVHTKASNASKAPSTFHIEDICLSFRNCTPFSSRVSLMWLSKGRMIFDSRHTSTERAATASCSLWTWCLFQNHLAFCMVIWMAQAANGEAMDIKALLSLDNSTTLKVIVSIGRNRKRCVGGLRAPL